MWDFGDGETKNGSAVTHKYDEGGEYVVTLIITKEDGTTDVKHFEIGVEGHTNVQSIAIFGIIIAMGMTGIASSLALGMTGSAAAGATAEKPENFGKNLVLQILPMTQGVYGLLASILLLMGVGLLGGAAVPVGAAVDPQIGMVAIGIGIVVGLTGLSAFGQAVTASASIGATARNPEVAGKGIIFSVMPETLAIFGLLVAIFIMVGTGLL